MNYTDDVNLSIASAAFADLHSLTSRPSQFTLIFLTLQYVLQKQFLTAYWHEDSQYGSQVWDREVLGR